MIASLPNVSIKLFALALLIMSCCIGSAVWSQEEKPQSPSLPVVFKEIPEKFTQRQDELGFFWQADEFGALTSGETQYLSSGLKLSANGTPFQPQTATLNDGSAANGVVDLELSEKRETLIVDRKIWFDLTRGGSRLIDSFTNTGKEKLTLRVELKTTYPFSWQNLHGSNRKLLELNPNPSLGERDFGLFVSFNQAEGRHDTLFITSGEKDAIRPVLAASSNRRELTFLYDIELGVGQSRSLVHWILQRNLGSPVDAETAFSPFYQRRRLIDSRVSASIAKTIANFDEQSFPQDGGTPARLESLVALNELVDSVGIHRRDEDILWISASNQLSGKLNPEAVIKINSPYEGEISLPISRIAAIQGGGGVGRVPRIFARDGRVFSGVFESENLSIKIGNDWTMDALQPEELNLLLCKLAPEDGTPSKSTACFSQLRDGTVLSVSEKEAPPISVVSPWGAMKLPFTEIDELGYVSQPTPRFRVVMPNGSRLTVFIPSETLSLTLASGKKVDLSTSLIARIWKESQTSATVVAVEDFWLDFTEIPENIRMENGFLLSGNNLLAGELEGTDLTLIDGTAVLNISVAEILSIQRSIDEGTARDPVFELEIKNGDFFSGKLRDPLIAVRSGDRVWEIPVAHLIAFQSREAK